MKYLLLLLSLLACSCGITPLYESKDHVSLYLVDKPKFNDDGAEIKFRFKSPTDDPHLVQEIKWNWWNGTGVEAFTVYNGELPLLQRDTHSSVREEVRTITIRPGKVEGSAETTLGFSMIPSGWPPGFNSYYLKYFPVKGQVIYTKDELGTTYVIVFTKDRIQLTVDRNVYTWKR